MALKEHPIIIAGCGPGSPDYLTARARRAIRKAEVLIGARRLLDSFPRHPAEKIEAGANIDKLLVAIENKRKNKRIVVLVTGDPGLCSLARPIVKRFGREACEIIPGISSIQFACARIGIDWLGVHIIDAHGADPEIAPDSLREDDRIAILAGRKGAIRWIAGLAEKLGRGRRIVVCEDLSLKTEKIREVNPAELQTLKTSPQTIVLIIREALFNS
jgi:cobalt-precorrin-7 (C5)-methyltransferase